MKKNKKLPLWSRLRNDHTQPYYPQLQSPHSLNSRRILTIHLFKNHLNNPRSQSLSHSPSSAPLVLLLLFLLLLLRRRRRASRISPLRRAGGDGRERACRDSNPGPVDVVQRRRPLYCHLIGVEWTIYRPFNNQWESVPFFF